MATERLPGFETLVGRWDETQHRSALADGRHAYFVGRSGSEPIGFAILRDWGTPERVTLVKRVAVCCPGRGYGRLLLSKVIDAAFGKPTPGAFGWAFSRRTTARAEPMRTSASRKRGLRAATRFLAASIGMS